MDILRCIQEADLVLPHSRPTTAKTFWNDELNSLKNDSIVSHDFWKLNGCPRNGPIFDTKKNAYYRYKLAIRDAKRNFDQEKVDRLNDDLLNGDHCKFWKSFKHFNYTNTPQTPRINGLVNDRDIATCFADTYKSVYSSNDINQSHALTSQFQSAYDTYHSEHRYDSIQPLLLSWSDMLDVLSNLKTGKSSASFVKAEHILYGSPKLAFHLHLLFNGMIIHSYVPTDFLNGVITPLIKDTEGDHTDPSNYRPLTLSVVFSTLFEHALLLKIGHLLNTDSVQFGYKRRHSVSHAIFTLRSCVDYFTSRGSNVFTAFLDCSKGFDKVNHSGMFLKLIQRKIPLCILNLLIYWYSNLTSIAKWNSAVSDAFSVPSGVRQGGVLSPHLFVIYIDDLIISLRNLKVGCYLLNLFIACIVYADDICLLAPCRSALQSLLDTCEAYGKQWCLTYNPLKSKIMIFGPNVSPPSLYMYGKTLHAAQEYKYHGVSVLAGSGFTTSPLRPLIRFRSSANSILNAPKKSSELMQLKLLYSICIPHLSYSIEVLNYSARQIQSFTVAVNDCLRRIFGYNRWESVRHLRISAGYPCITQIFASRNRRFMKRLPSLNNFTLNGLIQLIN